MYWKQYSENCRIFLSSSQKIQTNLPMFLVHKAFLWNQLEQWLQKYIEIEKILKDLKATEKEFFCKRLSKNIRFCQNFWKQRLLIWMTTLAQKFRF